MSLANATRSELVKQFTTSIWWVLAIVLAGYVGFAATGFAAVLGASASGALTGGSAMDPGAGAVGMVYSLASSVGYVFPLLIGTLLVTGEFRHQTLTLTFLATPRRGTVLWAKLLAGALMGLLYGGIAVVVTVGPGAGMLAVFGVDPQLASGHTWAMLARILVAFVLWLFIGIGTGLVVRNQIAAVVIVLAFTQFVEPLLRVGGSLVSGLADVARFLPGAASDTLVGSSIFGSMTPVSGEPLEWWAGGLVLAAYAAVLVFVGYLTSWRRDVA